MPDTEKKYREQRTFFWASDGHRLNLYLNGYMNVYVRADKFKDYVAAGLEALAAELRAEAAKARGQWLRNQAAAQALEVVVMPDEDREMAKVEKEVARAENK